MLPQARQSLGPLEVSTASAAPTASRRGCGPSSAFGGAQRFRCGTRECNILAASRVGVLSLDTCWISTRISQALTCTCMMQLYLAPAAGSNPCCVHAAVALLSHGLTLLLLCLLLPSVFRPNSISCNQRESTGRTSVQRNLDLAVEMTRHWPASTGISVPSGMQRVPPGPVEITPCDVFRLIRGRTLWIIG